VAAIDKIANGLPVASVEKIFEVMASRPELNLISDRAVRRAKSEKLPISAVNSQITYKSGLDLSAAKGFPH